jgi:hypothetical protein
MRCTSRLRVTHLSTVVLRYTRCMTVSNRILDLRRGGDSRAGNLALGVRAWELRVWQHACVAWHCLHRPFSTVMAFSATLHAMHDCIKHDSRPASNLALGVRAWERRVWQRACVPSIGIAAAAALAVHRSSWSRASYYTCMLYAVYSCVCTAVLCVHTLVHTHAVHTLVLYNVHTLCVHTYTVCTHNW